MDAYNVNNNREQQQQQQQNDYEQPPHEPTAASLIAAPTAPGQQQQTFSYSLPMHDADEEDSESNKSTPYYTPLEFSQSSFEFPSPKPKHAPADLTTTTTTTTKDQPLTSVAEYAARKLPTVPPSPSSSLGSPAITVVAATPSSCKAKPPTPGVAASTGSSALHSPPVINRKLRRFSLYERRSCSPQHLLVKNSSLGSGQDSPDPTHHLHHDKENTKPPHGDEPQLLHTPSGNSSPAALLEDGGPTATLSSPKILGAANEANMFGGGGGRLAYSPKLLASINNLNLSGSPLSVLSSAGYKNGNYFKFPEIDHVVQVAEAEGAEDVGHMPQDNQNRSSRRRGLEKGGGGGNSSPDALWGSRGNASGSMPRAAVSGDASEAGRPIISKSNAISVTDTRKNRKNKNNLTIRITDIAPQAAASLAGGSVAATTTTTMGISPSPSPSPKPKTPTIKSTKEKALSLDSAATGDHELKIIVSCRQDHGSCQDIDGSKASEGPAMGLDTVSLKIPDSSGAHLSSSLNQLSSEVAAGSLLCGSAMPNKPSFGLAGQRLGESFMRTSRRRISGSASGHSDWYQRQQNSFLSKSLNVDPCGEEAERPAIFTKVMQTSNSGSLGPSPGPGATASTPVGGGPRGPFKLNPLLHASNTNLKTLPEFLTLVEFSNPKEPAGPGGGGAESPYKQKSMDLPSSSLPAGLRVAKPPVTTSTSSTNLLQRRGSNHSLTLNLHGSCGNLLGNCRSGLSVSNYSLGSVAAASTTNLNSKSSGNLECGSSVTSHAPAAAAATTSAHVVVDKAAAAAGGDSTMAGSSAQVTKQTLFRRRGSNHSLTLTNLAATSCGSLNSFASQNSLNVDRLHLHPHGDAGGVAVGGGVTRTTSFITPSKLSGGGGGTKRGLLERRGSNQSLTLNMGGSFGGIGTERSHHHAAAAAAAASSTSNYYEAMGCGRAAAMAEPDTDPEADTGLSSLHPPTGCAQHRKFFSSESLNRNNTQFSDLNQAHKRNANQVCFGSVSDLKPSGEFGGGGGGGPGGGGSREHFDFQESTMCTCSGVRNIGTRPLSPQTTSEEFKIYLANIQMLQNASNALNQLDLIKLNYIFDNSYLASGGKGMASQPLPVLSVHESRDAETPPGLVATSEDHEVAARFQEAVGAALQRVQPSEEETKRLFCDLHKEFWDLPLNHQEKPMVFGSQAKNRYKTILPNENSRVLLERESTIWADLLANYDCLRDEWAEPLTPRQAAMAEEVPYINANYIKGPDYNSKCYVATQGPLPNTIFEFWLMVYLNTQKHLQNAKKLSSPITKNGRTLQQYYQKIVMLTNFLENNRQKCATYFPVELNELLVVTPKHEVLPANEPLTELLNEYLHLEDESSPQLADTQSESGSVSIEFLKTSLSAEQSSLMPQHTNFFAVKNVGIVRKNGFSIRKLIALYCVRIPAKEAGEPQQFLVQKFRCYHYWYPDWPDHRSPRDINTLLDICLHVLNLGKCEVEFDAFAEECSPGPGSPAPHIKAQEVALYQQDIFNSVQPLPIIHCSAGIGRTGCFTAILNGIRQLRQSLAYSLTSMASAASRRDGNGHVLSPVDFCLPADFVKDQPADEIDRILSNDTDSSFTRNTMLHMKYILERHGDVVAAEASGEWQLPSLRDLPKMPDVFVDILGIVCNLRLQRGGMVQNSEQYELIHRAICLYMKRAFALKRF